MFAAALATVLLAQNPACPTDLTIGSVAVQSTSTDAGTNIYHITGVVQNVGRLKQPPNTLQFVDVYEAGPGKVDSRGIPPLAPGQKYAFSYDFKRSVEAGNGTSHVRFRLDKRQPAGVESCTTAEFSYTLRV